MIPILFSYKLLNNWNSNNYVIDVSLETIFICNIYDRITIFTCNIISVTCGVCKKLSPIRRILSLLCTTKTGRQD